MQANDDEAQGTRAGDTRTGPGDLGRRVALRREQLGLTREEVARRAGMDPGYLRYVEEEVADAGAVGLIRLAGALETTTADLRGGGTDLPTGLGKAARHPELVDMSPEECRQHLSTHGVGRVAVATADGPAVAPVNYSVVDDEIVYRTRPGSSADPQPGTDVAFEVDHIDEAFSRGWSVLVVGRAERVTDTATADRLAERARTSAWAGGDRRLWIRVVPLRITGRRITVL
ncbi:helix-turn-helix domain-containing protein [Streptomyces sp. bgisy100]|uniref:helix-turn-helix domain-containing protein n=1 Tax=Streptomyces sp. bgisy100 TaxID=3413783 RepID=UPI003D743D25